MAWVPQVQFVKPRKQLKMIIILNERSILATKKILKDKSKGQRKGWLFFFSSFR